MNIDKQLVQLAKTVKVSDPENWYKEDSVTVSLYVTKPYKNRTTVRIAIYSIDDFAVSLDYDTEAKYEAQIKFVYNHFKKWIYDRMPEEISLVWLYEHGFLPM